MLTDDEIETLITIIQYNGYEEEVLGWESYDRYQGAPYDKLDPDSEAYCQLQIIWMYLVLSIGEYGTSPRFGWLTDMEAFGRFIDKLKEEYDLRQSLHYE